MATGTEPSASRNRTQQSEIREANQAIEEITGEKVRFYRPAWGLFNLCSICYYRLKGLKVILWTFMSWDWGNGRRLKASPTEY